MLIRFLQACHESKQLYEQFFFSIYKPLHQYFDDEKAAPISNALGRVLDKWSSLLDPGPIKHRMLSAESSEAVHNMNLSSRSRDTRFNLVLRLVPDFAVKGYEALFLARQWRDVLGSSGYNRELKFIHNKRHLALRCPPRQQPGKDSAKFAAPPCDVYQKLERKLAQPNESESRLKDRSLDTSENCNYAVEMTVNACESGITPSLYPQDSSRLGIDHFKTELKREQIRVQKIRTEIRQGQIASRYTTERPMVRPILDRLDAAKDRCRRLRNEISKQDTHSSCLSDRLHSRSSFQTSSDSFVPERIRSVTRPLLNSRHRAQTREQREICEDHLRLSKLCS